MYFASIRKKKKKKHLVWSLHMVDTPQSLILMTVQHDFGPSQLQMTTEFALNNTALWIYQHLLALLPEDYA